MSINSVKLSFSISTCQNRMVHWCIPLKETHPTVKIANFLLPANYFVASYDCQITVILTGRETLTSSLLPPYLMGVNSQRKEFVPLGIIFSFKSRPQIGSFVFFLSKEAKWKSWSLPLFENWCWKYMCKQRKSDWSAQLQKLIRVFHICIYDKSTCNNDVWILRYLSNQRELLIDWCNHTGFSNHSLFTHALDSSSCYSTYLLIFLVFKTRPVHVQDSLSESTLPIT